MKTIKMKTITLILTTFIFLVGYASAQEGDKQIAKVGTFPENYVGQTLTFGKTWVWFRLSARPSSDKSSDYYRIEICSSSNDCYTKLGLGNKDIVAVVDKSMAAKLIDADLSSENIEYIARVTGTVKKKLLFCCKYGYLINKIEIYSTTGQLIETLQ